LEQAVLEAFLNKLGWQGWVNYLSDEVKLEYDVTQDSKHADDLEDHHERRVATICPLLS
jgi:hypothetical protein